MSRIKLQFAEAETGIVLDSDGKRARSDSKPYEPVYDSNEEAKLAADDYLEKFEHAECCFVEEGKEPFVVRSPRFEDYLLAQRIKRSLLGFFGDAFNRSIGALSDAGALNLKKMNKEYTGIGSRYYDMVTRQMEITAEYSLPTIRKIIDDTRKETNKK